MTAKEARELAHRSSKSKIVKQLEIILKEITVAANVGNFSILFDGSLISEVEKELESLGYTVKYIGDPRDGSYYNISW